MCDFVFTDNHYLINRCDGLIIDGNPSGVSQQIYSMNREKENAKIRILKKTDEFKELEPFKENPYAIAHYVNHSPTRKNSLFLFTFTYFWFIPLLISLLRELHFNLTYFLHFRFHFLSLDH
eukprot:TRINITY_DN1419_c0_g1_i4.p1 TRINITY_DN1419_c0_g1~~TRINITY_DN1419_c0_g1_i4.p1  ORF type:complete len:121 (+),score=11.86 TRINITY_DN1419_c0_g1_i4:329-691(+)